MKSRRAFDEVSGGDCGQLQELPWAKVWAAHTSESGLMGLAVDPDFENNGFLYACYT
jgi:hypothetical protein